MIFGLFDMNLHEITPSNFNEVHNEIVKVRDKYEVFINHGRKIGLKTVLVISLLEGIVPVTTAMCGLRFYLQIVLQLLMKTQAR